MALKQLVLLILGLLLLTSSAAAFELFTIEGIDVHGGLLWFGNAEAEGAPSPLLWEFGVSSPFAFTDFFLITPELSMFWNQYQLSESGVKAIPTEIETANQVTFITLVLDLQAMFRFRITEQIAAGPVVFPSFVFRIPTKSWDAAAEDAAYKQKMTEYLYGDGRFFYPGIGGFFQWAFSERFGFLFQLKTRLPLFHAWDEEGISFHDQMMVGAAAGIQIYF